MNFFKKNYLLILIILGGFFLRFCGIGFDLPLSSSVGDEFRLMAGGLKMLSEHSFFPTSDSGVYFPLMYYINVLGILIYASGLFLVGAVKSISELKNAAILSLGDWLIVSRVISLLLGTISIYLVYLISLKIWPKKSIALWSAWLLAISPLNVAISHFGKIWTPQVFFLFLAIYFIIRFWQTPQDRPSWLVVILTPIFILLSFYVNLIGILAYPVFLLVCFVYFCQFNIKKFVAFIFSWRSLIFHLIMALGVVLVVFLAKDAWITYGFGLKIFLTSGEQADNWDPLWGPSVWNRLGLSLDMLMQFETALFLFLVPSFWFLFKKAKNNFYFLLFLFLGFWLALNPPLLHSTRPRYLAMMIPVMILPVAYFFDACSHWLYSKKWLLSIGLVILVVLPAMFINLKYDYLLNQNSTKLDLFYWLKNNITPKEKVFLAGDYLLQDLPSSAELISLIKKNSPDYYSARLKYLDQNFTRRADWVGYDVYSDGFFCLWPEAERKKIKFDYIALVEPEKGRYDLKKFKICDTLLEYDLTKKPLIWQKNTAPYYQYSIEGGVPFESYRPLGQIKKLGKSVYIYKLD